MYNQSCENNVLKRKTVTVQFCKGQLPLHLTVGCHKTYSIEGKFKYIIRKSVQTRLKGTDTDWLELNISENEKSPFST